MGFGIDTKSQIEINLAPTFYKRLWQAVIPIIIISSIVMGSVYIGVNCILKLLK